MKHHYLLAEHCNFTIDGARLFCDEIGYTPVTTGLI